MPRPRIGFLPAFFTVLAIGFCIALWLRLRSYSSPGTVARSRDERVTTSVSGRGAETTGSSSLATSSESSTIAAEVPVQSPRTQNNRRKIPLVDLTSAPDVNPNPALTTAAARPASQRPAEKPSLLSRLVNPIVNAITGSHPTAAGVQPGQPVQASSGSRGGSNTTATDTTGTADKNDRTSDTTPPQLISIAFNPPQVHDGEDTVLNVQATDDLSGVRSISGTIVAPSGAVQGFALQRELNTDTYTARITVPKDAAEGLWRVNYLSLIDNASNATTITGGAQGALPPTASFRVISSSPDSTGPTLKAVWLDHPAMKAGEKNVVFVQADDDKSGVNLVSGVFISPARHARIGFVCRPGSGDWECELTTPACIDCGDWQLEQLQLQDKANNMTTVRSDNPLVAAVRVNISGDRCDSTPPAVQSLALDRAVVSNVEDSIITVTAAATDDVCGIMSMSGQVTGPSGGGGAPRLYFSFTPSEGQLWMGRISVPKLAAKGVWRITWIQVLDQGHNLRTYSQGDAPLAAGVFTVQ